MSRRQVVTKAAGEQIVFTPIFVQARSRIKMRISFINFCSLTICVILCRL